MISPLNGFEYEEHKRDVTLFPHTPEGQTATFFQEFRIELAEQASESIKPPETGGIQAVSISIDERIGKRYNNFKHI